MNIRLEDGPCSTFVVRADSGNSRLIQIDYDFPNLASTFGWPACDCGAMHGCEYRTRSDMIQGALLFLNAEIGAMAEAPGYF